MSNFMGVAVNPANGKPEEAAFMDNYFGHHRYGVRFKDGGVYRMEELAGWQRPLASSATPPSPASTSSEAGRQEPRR